MKIGDLPVYMAEIIGNYNLLTPVSRTRIRARQNMVVDATMGGKFVLCKQGLADTGFTAVQFDMGLQRITGKDTDDTTRPLTLRQAGKFFSSVMEKKIKLLMNTSFTQSDVNPEVVIDKVYLGKVYNHFGNIVDYYDENSTFIEEAVIVSVKRREKGK